MSILDTAPKTSVKLLVGRQQELQEVVRSVIEHRITVVLGPRRIGKTSLIKVALRVLSGKEKLSNLKLETRFIPIYIDMWSIVATTRSSRKFFEHLDNMVLRTLEDYDEDIARDYRKRMRLAEELVDREASLQAVLRFGGKRGVLYRYPLDATRCLDELDAVLAKHGRKAILAIDEAQELGTLKPFSPTAWLAHIHDNLTRVHVLLSGSYIGLMKKVLHPKQRDPLYGRDINRINIGKLDPGSLLSILLKGLEERGIGPSREFSQMLEDVAAVLRDARLAHQLPLYKDALHELGSVLGGFTVLLLALVSEQLLSSFMVYYAANLLMQIGFDPELFAMELPEEKSEEVKPLIEFLASPVAKAFAVLSLFMLSGSPSLVISLAKKLPNGFTEDDLLRVGLRVLDESYRAVCDEVNRLIGSYSKKPEIIVTILYSLYSSPRTWGSIVKLLTRYGVDKKSVNENLKTLVELGYIAKYKEGVNTYYYITDPLLFYALRERCIGV